MNVEKRVHCSPPFVGETRGSQRRFGSDPIPDRPKSSYDRRLPLVLPWRPHLRVKPPQSNLIPFCFTVGLVGVLPADPS